MDQAFKLHKVNVDPSKPLSRWEAFFLSMLSSQGSGLDVPDLLN